MKAFLNRKIHFDHEYQMPLKEASAHSSSFPVKDTQLFIGMDEEVVARVEDWTHGPNKS